MDEPAEGDIVRCTVASRHPWGVTVQIEGFPDVPASIDMMPADSGSPIDAYPALGTPIEAVVAERRPNGNGGFYFRLSHRPEPIEHARRTGVAYPWQLDRSKHEFRAGQVPDNLGHSDDEANDEG